MSQDSHKKPAAPARGFGWGRALLLLLGAAAAVSLLFVATSRWIQPGVPAGLIVSFVTTAIFVTYVVDLHFQKKRLAAALNELKRASLARWSPVLLDREQRLTDAIEILNNKLGTPISTGRTSAEAAPYHGQTISVCGIRIENIRCFRNIDASFDLEDAPARVTLLLGDNSCGKTTLLRCIALGLSPESHAIALINQLPGSFIREGAAEGSIETHLRSVDRSWQGRVRLVIKSGGSRGQQVIRQETEPADFPWEKILVCGYGTQRAAQGSRSYERYEPREAVATLFSDAAQLLNPEVVMLRKDTEVRERLEQVLREVLMLPDDTGIIARTPQGIQLRGPWGSHLLAAVSDGYRCTTQWVVDCFGWQILAEQDGLTSGGLLLIDEIEQHLHPRWQRYVLQRISQQFPRMQIIASSHTPLIAAGMADVEHGELLQLERDVSGEISSRSIRPESLNGKRADQILADAFGVLVTRNPGSEGAMDEYSELLSKPDRTPDEEERLARLRTEMQAVNEGSSVFDDITDEVIDRTLTSTIDSVKKAMVNQEVRQRLQQLRRVTTETSE